MTQATSAEVEKIKEKEDVRRALQQTATVKETTPPVETRQKVWFAAYIVALLALGSVYYALRLNVFGIAARYVTLPQRFTLGVMAIVLVLAVAKFADVYLIEPLDDTVSRYNLKRVLRLVVGMIFVFVAVSILFANWYTAVVSLGLISLILGFALQTPSPASSAGSISS